MLHRDTTVAAPVAAVVTLQLRNVIMTVTTTVVAILDIEAM